MPTKPKGILKKRGARSQNRVNAGVKFNNEVEEKFTKEEIAQIIARHKEIVETMNKYLPDNQKVAVDPDLEKKLQDPKLAKMYHLGKEIKERDLNQSKTFEEVKKKYGSTKLSFSLAGSFRPGKTLEDKTYNEQLYRNYKDNPEKFIHKQYNNVLSTSGKELYELGDDPIKQAEYYLNNYEKCSYASNIDSVVNNSSNKNLFTEEFKANSKSVGSLAHNLYKTKYAVKNFDSFDKLAFPSLNKEQINKLYDSSFSFDNQDKEDLRTCLTNAKYGWGKQPSPKENFDAIKEKTGVDLSNQENFATSKIFLGKDGKAMNLEGLVAGEKEFGSVKEITDPNQKREMKFMTNHFKETYMDNWKKKFNEKMGVEGNKIDIKAIEDKHKGSLFHRLFRKPSKEYTEMMKAFKDYNNPESEHYLNKDRLDSKTQAYVDHKAAKGKEATGADKDRVDFANNILSTNKESDRIYKTTESAFLDKPMQKRVTFLLPEDVDIENVKQKENVKENVAVKAKEEPAKEQEKEEEIAL